MEKIQVTVDGELEEIMPRYIELRWKELEELESAVVNEDGESVRILGHKLKGSGASYGLERLTELGTIIEVAGLDSNFSEARRQASHLRGYLDALEIIYRYEE